MLQRPGISRKEAVRDKRNVSFWMFSKLISDCQISE